MTTCGSSPASGPSIATRTSRPAGSSAGTSARSTSPGTTSGYSATATAAPTCSGSPGRKSSGTRWSGGPRHPTTPPWPDTGLPGGDRGIPRPIDTATLRLLQSQHGRCPCCGELLLDADRPPQSPREWEQWLAATRKAITSNAIASGGRHPGRGQTPPPARPLLPALRRERKARHFCPPRALGACPSRDAGKLACPVPRGGGRSNAPGLPGRVVRSRAGAGPPSPSSRSPAARSASARWPARPAHSARP